MKTGSPFQSNPKDAEIIVNDSSLGLKTPVKINGWTPGKYAIKYRLDGHRESLLNITVESNKTTKASVSMKDTTVWVDYQTNNSTIPSNILSCIEVDNEDIIWIGTASEGLIRFDGKNFESITMENSDLPSNKINSITVDEENTKWICTNGGGLALLDNNNNWTLYNTSNSELKNNIINSVYIRNSEFVPFRNITYFYFIILCPVYVVGIEFFHF